MTVAASARRPRASRHRLRGTGAFEAVFAAGRRLDGRYLQLVAAPAGQSIGRIGYVIGRKSMPRAVDRNRLRRRLREIVRAARPPLDAFDVIVRVKSTVAPAEVAQVAAEGARLVRKLLGTAA